MGVALEPHAIVEFPLVHTKKIRHVSWNFHGDKLATCSDDKLVCVWDADRGVLRQSLSGHNSRISCGSWSENDWLVTCSRDHSVIVWDLLANAPKFVCQFNNALSAVHWYDSDNLIIGDEKGNLFFGTVDRDVRFEKIHTAESRVVSICRSKARSLIFVAHADGTVLVFSESMATHEKLHVGKIRGFAVGHDLIASCGDDSKIICRSLRDFSPALTLDTDAKVNHSVAFDSEGKQLVAFGNDQSVTRWKLDDPHRADQFQAARTHSRIMGAAFHPQLPKLALVGKSQKRISLLDLGSDQAIKKSEDAEPSVSTQSTHCDILVVTANPAETTPLQLEDEAKKIKDCFQSVAGNQDVVVFAKHAAAVNELRRCLHQMKPRIVHFAGHGNENGNLIFQSDDGGNQFVNPNALSELLREFPEIEIVMLNACYSAHAAELIAEHVECVVGMGCQIDDDSAMQFALAFYESLAFGHGFDRAFRLGVNAIKLNQLPDAEQPMAFLPDMRVDLADKLESVSSIAKPSSGNQPLKSAARSETQIETDKEVVSVKLWFGTIRKLKEPAMPSSGFGNVRDDKINYGVCEVAVPKRRKVGSLGSGFWRRLITWNDDLVKFDRSSIALQDSKSYWRDLSQTIEQLGSDEKHALVFIHGYNVSFRMLRDGLLRSQQIFHCPARRHSFHGLPRLVCLVIWRMKPLSNTPLLSLPNFWRILSKKAALKRFI